ncbi:MAG: PEP-CTERM sorting domain-containing protein, partial [Verrucomicrobia bacterium]|nr:PEP-CTERM sorting domain-containing protein [Verrucomicrobiota bacterium]
AWSGVGNTAGAVAYTYGIGKYEVSRSMIEKANTAGTLGITLQDMFSYGGNGANRPATGINWYEAAVFVNWLNTSSGGTAAYKFDGGGNFQLWSPGDTGYDANNLFRNSLARYWLPSRDEWYKAAYGNSDGTWNNYTTGNNTAPTSTAGGTDPGTTVFGLNFNSGPADIDNAGGLSAFGTMAQGGNVFEWTESAADGVNSSESENRGKQGGAYYTGDGDLAAPSFRFGVDSPSSDFIIGLRVATVPEPSALSLMAIGCAGLVAFHRRRTS